MNIKAVSYQKTPGGGRHKTINDYIDEKYKIEEDMAEIEKTVASVEDYRCRMVLRYKYFEFMTLEQISDSCMFYSVRQLKRIHNQGISCLADKVGT